MDTSAMIEESSLESDFLETALRRSDYLRRNEPRRANKELKEQMRRLPDKGAGSFKRIGAALLAVDEPFAMSVLEQIQAGCGLQSFSAEMTIKEWRAGHKPAQSTHAILHKSAQCRTVHDM